MDYSRNWLFVSADLQEKLARTKILVAGLGIGSVFAETAVRSGFCHLTIADGDHVEASNLNRQNYTTADLKLGKAPACAQRLRAIAPDLELTVIEAFLRGAELEEAIKNCDFVINTIDFDAPEFQELSQHCRRYRKIELFPINLGFGASLTLIDHRSPTWRQIFPTTAGVPLKLQILQHIVNAPEIEPYLLDAADIYFNKAAKNPSYDSQLAVSCQIAASMMVSSIMRLLTGEDLQMFPHFYYLDTHAQVVLGSAAKRFRSIA